MTTFDDPRGDIRDSVAEPSDEILLYESARTRVARRPALRTGAVDERPSGAETPPVIWKEPLGPGRTERIHHESAILTTLAAVPGVAHLIPTDDPDGLALEDVGGVSLASTLTGSAGQFVVHPGAQAGTGVLDLVAFALSLARILTGVHQAGVMHKDINPSNILITGTDRRPTLIDWDLATTFAEERPGFTHENKIAGTLAYLAPEQSGRTGRSVDQRADLYAVGATLYELAAGRPPFEGSDPLTLIHDHLARVPRPPRELNPAVPVMLSDIIMRLLEKEPDRRYQSAPGLAHDLARLLETLGASLAQEPENPRFVLGQRDFPIRITAPSQLVGRDVEIGALGTALDQAVDGRGRGLLVTGAPGVGKSSLIAELRSMVTAKSGWFVQGKFDQYSQDESTNAVSQVMRALARLLLAEPEDQLARLRARILETVGPETEVLVALVPEFAVVLGVGPSEVPDGDPQVIGARAVRAGLGVLRALASPQRPLVMAIDDLQWAAAFPIAFLETVLLEDGLDGLLLVLAYRDGEVDSAHPFSATLNRWERLGATPTSLHLTNLPPDGLSTMLAQMLRLPAGPAADLAEAVNARTHGNPYDTVELVNALRREGVLSVGEAGWQWQADTIRSFIGRGDVIDLIIERIEALPAEAASLLEVMACLGGDVDLDLLALAAGQTPTAITEALAPALRDGLLVMIHDAAPAARFRHDRVQQAAAARLEGGRLEALHLQLARRLVAHPRLEAAAAEHYLAAAPEEITATERPRVVELFRAAAAQTRLIYLVQSERFLSAALVLLETAGELPPAGAPESELATQLLIERHAALLSLARLEETDELYPKIQQRTPGAAELAGAAAVQISSLTARGRNLEAVALSVELLTRLGFAPPAEADIPAAIGAGLERLDHWLAAGPQPDELHRPEPGDPCAIGASRLIERSIPPAYSCGHPLMPWLILQAHRIWVEHGPNAPLVGSLGGLELLGVMIRQDYTSGYRAGQRILAVGEARGYEPATSQLRTILSMFAQPWFEPLEDTITQARIAREGLLRHGELPFVSYSYASTTEGVLVCGATLAESAAEYAAATTFMTRLGDDNIAAFLRPRGQLVRCLTGLTTAPGRFDDDDFDETAYQEQIRENPLVALNYYWVKAMAMAVFWDPEQLAQHAAQAMELQLYMSGTYPSAVTHLLHALALAEQVKAAAPGEQAAVLAEFDRSRDWLAARAGDAPENFGYLVTWLDAERAWAIADHEGATGTFNAALREVTRRRRPWHAAIITERAARFHLARGLDYTGWSLLAEARARYQQWGATAKVSHLDREFPELRATSSATTPPTTAAGRTVGSVHTAVVSSEAIDLMAVLRAAQALSSETNLDRLRARVVEVLTTMTGATSVRLALWNPEAQSWFLPAAGGPDETDSDTAISVEEAGQQKLICLSAFRYAERTLEPLLVPDATHDDRFSRDPYLEGLDSCSLLVVPILSRGAPRAMLLMENQLSHGLFTADRLDAVVLIAGQLAVCLDNALAERFRSLVQRSSNLTLVCDRAGLLSYASSASTEILGIDDTQLIGCPVTDLIHPDDRETFSTWIGHDGPAGQTLECRLLPADSGLRRVEVSCTDLTGDPAVAALVLHLRDVTERRLLEGELRHAQKLESVGQLAAGVAHEINTPIQFIADNLRFIAENLTPINGLLDRYREALADTGSAEDRAAQSRQLTDLEAEIDLEFLRAEIPLAADQALDGTQRVARIVRAMKAFAHPGGEGKDASDLNEAIRNTLIVADSEIKLVADVVLDLGHLPPVVCNLGDINQAILNLVINAAHAMSDAEATGRGRGTLTIRTRSEDSATVLVEIQDTGNGIPDDIADRVFEQFFTTKAVGIGTGQGLSLVYTLIHDRHKGTINFSSEPGVGTTFSLRLPNGQPQVPPDAQ
jgi:PAS domain S-box-containing protein